MNNHSISVIVLSHNPYTKKNGCIEAALYSLMNQKNITFQIIVINNSSSEEDTEKLINFINQEKSSNPIQLINCNACVAKARNIGVMHAVGDLIIFTEEDMIHIDDLSIFKIDKIAIKNTYGYGAIRLWTKIDWFEKNINEIASHIKMKNFKIFYENSGLPDPSIRNKNTAKYLVRSFIGNFGFIKKIAFQQLNGFPEQFMGYSLEDDAFSFFCYLELGKPTILQDISVIHISHSINKSSYEDYIRNLKIYSDILNFHGYKSFHIGDLLYPEHKTDRPILE